MFSSSSDTGTCYDVIIVGGGPAGMSAALTLVRAQRNILLCTKGNTRNAWSEAMHGYLSRDGMNPKEFLQLGLDEIKRYGVRVQEVEVVKALHCAHYFELETDAGETLRCRKLLLTTGVKDKLPEIEGFRDFYGTSIHHCPYCDGWEHRGKRIAVYAQGGGATSLPFHLQAWSPHITLCTDAAEDLLTDYDRDLLRCNGVEVYEQKIQRVQGSGKQVEQIVFQDGSTLSCDAIFFSTGTEPRSALTQQLGCKRTKKGNVKTDKFQQTNVKGLYVAGDAARDMQLVIVAAAEGAKAAVAINMALQEEAKVLPDVGKEVEEGI